MIPILTIIGPTGIGKTRFVCKGALKHPFEVISLDSAMVYKELTIAANKPSEEDLALCPHHVIDCRSVIQTFDVAQFFNLAIESVKKIVSRGKIPVFLGGTMMYAHVLKAGLVQWPTFERNEREQFTNSWKNKPIYEVYKALQSLDPETALRLHSSDTQRIFRALEIATLLPTAHDRAQWRLQSPKRFPFALNFVGLEVDSVEKHRILLEKRIDSMIAKGMVDEISSLYKNFGDSEYRFWRFVAYRQYKEHFQGKDSLQEAREKTAFATYRLAKHQRTWMNTIKPLLFQVELSSDSAKSLDLESYLDKYGQLFFS